MRLLLIEDYEEKAKKVREFVLAEFPEAQIIEARSITSALRTLLSPSSTFDALLLDMSMPTFDEAPQEPAGGAPESKGGRDLLSQMKLREIRVPTIVVTMFTTFDTGPGKKQTVSQLHEELLRDYAPTYLGLVRYDSGQEGWKRTLRNLLQEVIRK
jgi:CheY-like chemotaxis protein